MPSMQRVPLRSPTLSIPYAKHLRQEMGDPHVVKEYVLVK